MTVHPKREEALSIVLAPSPGFHLEMARVMKSPLNVRGSGRAYSKWLSEAPAWVCRANRLVPTFVLLGALALVFSSVSPADDDIQQAFFHEKPHCSRLAAGSFCTTHLPRSSRIIQAAALLASGLAPHRELAAAISVAETHLHVAVVVPTDGQRPPPIS